MLDDAMNGFQRILRAAIAALDLGDIALDGVNGHGLGCCGQSGRSARRPRLVDVNQEIGQAALDGLEIAETRVGGIEPFDQLRDAGFEMPKRGVIGMGELHPFKLLDESAQQLFELARHRVAGFGRSAQRIGKCLETAFKRRNGATARCAIGDLIDLRGQCAHVLGNLRQCVVGGDMRNDSAQRPDRGFELLQGGRIFLADDQVDFLRQRPHCVVETDQVLGGRQAVQRIAHFGQSALKSGKRG